MFAKVFSQIFDSSIADDRSLRHFFIDLLILADADGYVDMTPSAIAGRTRWPLQEVDEHLRKLSQPDTKSRTPDYDGRRIELLDEHRDWGWRIINYSHFRSVASEEQRKAKQRERFQRWKQKSSSPANASLTVANASNAMQKQKQKQKQKELYVFFKNEISNWFGRRETTKWSEKEDRLLKSVFESGTHPDDLAALKSFYKAVIPSESDYRRRNIETLLNNWNGEIDKAKKFKPARRESLI